MPRSEVRSIKVTGIPFGLNPGEAIAALFAVVSLVLVLVYYFSSLKPEQDRLRILEAELSEQQKNIIASTGHVGEEATFLDTAKSALETLDAFKTSHLKPFSSGRISLIKEINALAKKNNVALTSGIDMGSSMGDSGGEGEKSTGETKRKKADEMLSAIPSVAFRFTVFGPYSNVRTFINELEHDKQFVVINSVNLSNQDARATSRRSRGEGMSGIMLTIEMSAYFQPM
ncbi:MAG: hypothetical protein AABN34_17735 [Acidobacteriota bacterium]